MLVESVRTETACDPETPSHLTGSRSLLLNASYEPMRVLSWQKALILWFQGKVEVLEYHSVFIRSVRSSFQLPSVMRLKTYVKPRSYGAVRFCRENVYIRDNHTCQYCGIRYSTRVLTLDHVVPVSKQGPKTWTNVVTACRECNQKKGNRTPVGANMPLLKTPVVPSWLPSAEMDIASNNFPQTWLQYLKFKAG
jgi:5-methylcytosine-specific restriction endonuclease McrA